MYIYRPETRTTDQPTSRVTIILQIINFPQEFTINEQKYPIVNIILRNDWRNK